MIPMTPFTLYESHAPVPDQFSDEIEQGDMEPVLIVQGTIFPQGRMQSVNIRGINPGQTIFRLPTHKLDTLPMQFPLLSGL
jgi:putative ABC transport system permease protein